LTAAAELRLVGAGGEPVDFARTIVSHGVAELPPNRVDLAGRALETTLPVRRGARTVRITARGKKLHLEGSADAKLKKTVAHMFRLDEDLPASMRSCARTSCPGARSAPGACCARRPSSKTSSRQSERPYERELGSFLWLCAP